MIAQLRDTEFGQLVRLLSRDKLFQYSDERDQLKDHKFGRHNTGCESDAGPRIEVVTDTKLDKDIHLISWDADNDRENPQNWSRAWKLFVTAQICLMNFAFYMGSSIYVPGEASIRSDLHVSTEVATLGLSLYTLGYGTGPMLFSPFSELPSLGRRRIYVYTFLAYALLQLPVGCAPNMPVFLIFRYITGFVGSPALATGGATIADMYGDATNVATGIAVWGSFGICGPVFGPILGGFASAREGWRITIWIITWLSSFVVILIFFCMPETSAANILYRRAKRLRLITGNARLRSQSELGASDITSKNHLKVLSKASTLTFSEPMVFALDLYTALCYGVLFTWFESFPLVFGNIYNFTPGEQGLVFLGIFIGGLVTLPPFLYWTRYILGPKFKRADFEPEMILPPSILGSICLPMCLFMYGWTARRSVPWIVPVVGSGLFTVSIITLFNPVLTYLGMVYKENAASVSAGNTLFRASFGAVFPLVARQMFETLGIGPGNSLLGGLSVLFIPLPILFYKYGRRIRRRSKDAQHN